MKSNFFLIFFFFSSFVFAEEKILFNEVITERYIASIQGEEGCVLPENPKQIKNGECKVTFKTVDFGIKLIEIDGVCKKVTSTFDGYKTIIELGHTLNLPKAKYTVENVPCN